MFYNKFLITHHYQPIYDLKTKQIIAYEALMRSGVTSMLTPLEIIKTARINQCLTELDLNSIKMARENFESNSAVQLFLNVFPSTLMEKGFVSWWDENMSNDKSVVLELLESESISDWDTLRKVVEDLRNRGVKIAVDDLGTGSSTLQRWIELIPEYTKLDNYFVTDIVTNMRKQKVLTRLMELFSDYTKVIIEGVETKEELAIIESLEIPYGQGYYLGVPEPIAISSSRGTEGTLL